MNPSAFISYSWDDDSHKAWVKEFAAELRASGIESILDQWHTVPGDQLPEFMENAIKNNDFVLIVCTPNYKKKSDSRSGGVGYEGDIITGEVFVSRNHKKFIPILARGSWEESSPTWMKGKYYIDLSDGNIKSSNFKELVSTLHGKNESPPPISPVNNSATSISLVSSSDKYVDKVMKDILDLFKSTKADVGHVLNDRVFLHQYIFKYNPKEKAAIDGAIAELEKQHLIEIKNKNVFLTQTGVDYIY